jgi:hypothetical protein
LEIKKKSEADQLAVDNLQLEACEQLVGADNPPELRPRTSLLLQDHSCPNCPRPCACKTCRDWDMCITSQNCLGMRMFRDAYVRSCARHIVDATD